MQQAIITWVEIEDRLPELNKPVLIHRYGGKNNHDDVRFAYRKHKWGTRDEWEWIETSGNYWGISIDGSSVKYWTDLPTAPK